MWRHKNEGEERRSGKENPRKEMDNPSFLYRHMADFFRHFVYLPLEVYTVQSSSGQISLLTEYFLWFLIINLSLNPWWIPLRDPSSLSPLPPPARTVECWTSVVTLVKLWTHTFHRMTNIISVFVSLNET